MSALTQLCICNTRQVLGRIARLILHNVMRNINIMTHEVSHRFKCNVLLAGLTITRTYARRKYNSTDMIFAYEFQFNSIQLSLFYAA